MYPSSRFKGTWTSTLSHCLMGVVLLFLCSSVLWYWWCQQTWPFLALLGSRRCSGPVQESWLDWWGCRGIVLLHVVDSLGMLSCLLRFHQSLTLVLEYKVGIPNSNVLHATYQVFWLPSQYVWCVVGLHQMLTWVLILLSILQNSLSLCTVVMLKTLVLYTSWITFLIPAIMISFGGPHLYNWKTLYSMLVVLLKNMSSLKRFVYCYWKWWWDQLIWQSWLPGQRTQQQLALHEWGWVLGIEFFFWLWFLT